MNENVANTILPVLIRASRSTPCVLLALIGFLAGPSVFAQGTAFTYQGRLSDGGVPATGSYDLRVILYTADVGGSQVGPILTITPTLVSNGLFTATLDFGVGVFTGSDRWLDIAARTNGAGAFTPLTPRQYITATPYAITASNLTGALPASQLSGTLGSAQLAANSVDNSKIVDGTIVNADMSASAAIADTKLATISTAGKVADTALSASVSLLGPTIESAEITDGAIVNADINAAAAIVDTKLATIATSGKVSDTALSANVALLNAVQTNTVDKYFAGQAQLFVIQGFASQPAIAFKDYPTTGFFSAGPDSIGLGTGGAERLKVTSSGRVGIGVTSPSVPLHVDGGSDAGLSSGGYVVAGPVAGQNLVFDDNEIMSRNNGGTSQLVLNNNGGGVSIGASGGGNVGIGTASPTTPLHVATGTDATLSGGGYIMAGSTNGANVVIDNNEIMARNNGAPANLSLSADTDGIAGHGSVIVGNDLIPRTDNYSWLGNNFANQSWFWVSAYNYYTVSDVRLKDNIQPLHYGLQTVLSLRPVSYDWKKKTGRKILDDHGNLGLIAQQVEPIVPEAVGKDENPEHHLALNYNMFIPILIKAVQEQQALIDAQRTENAELKRRLDKLELLVIHPDGGGK